MTYTEYYTSKEAIKAADTITREAFVVACTLYEPHWGWKDHLNCMTEDKLPIVYAFNIAETIKRRIVSSTNHISTIKEETNLLHLFSKNNFTSINWAYQQNTILGILYYMLAFSEGITSSALHCIEEQSKRLYGMPNEKGALYLTVFKNAVAKKQKLEEDILPTEKQDVKVDNETAQMLFNKIFRDGLDMKKISDEVLRLLDTKDKATDLVFTQQRHWYIVYQWFLEIGFIEKLRTAKIFREWTMAIFGKRGYATENDFSEAKKIYDGKLSDWEPNSDHIDFIIIRNNLSDIFSKENRNKYLIKDRYIDWSLGKK